MEKTISSTCIICNSICEDSLQVTDHSISKEQFQLIECPTCQLRITSDAPAEDSIAPYYKSEDYISHSNSTKGLINRLYHIVRQIMLNRKANLIKKISKGNKLLDYGAGLGYFASTMVQNGFDVDAFELNREAREKAKELFQLDIHESSYLNEIDKQFDVVTMWHVLEHLYDPNAYLNRFHELLNKEGRIVIAVPNFQSVDAKKYQEYWAGYDVPRHVWHFSPKSMEKLLSKNGFVLEKIRPMPFDGFYVSMLSEKYRNSGFSNGKGLWHGLMAYFMSIGSPQKSSSIIYIAKKQ